jgi:hypothetical protein
MMLISQRMSYLALIDISLLVLRPEKIFLSGGALVYFI